MAPLRYVVAREFEYLVPRDVNQPHCHEVGGESFKALRSFILENREGDAPLDLMRLCSKKGIGEAIQLMNYVGVIELRDGLQVEVLPKIDIAPGANDTDRTVFAHMLQTLGTDVPFRHFDRTGLATGKTPLFEVFISMFLEEVADLTRRGIRSTYVTIETEERYLRGKIDFSREARKGGGKAEVLNLIHDELSPNRPENRIVRTTLLYLLGHSHSAENISKTRRLLTAFEGVPTSRNTESDLKRCVIDRSTRSYAAVLAWCRIFLRGESFSMFKGENVATALLFPMERIFEDFVGASIKRMAARDDTFKRVRLQAKGQWLFEDRRIGLRPDILCELSCGRFLVLDTKWKHVTGRRDLSIADMYQMYAYGKRYHSPIETNQHVVLVYPWHKGVAPGMMPEGRHMSSDGVQVEIFFFDVANPKTSVAEILAYASNLVPTQPIT